MFFSYLCEILLVVLLLFYTGVEFHSRSNARFTLSMQTIEIRNNSHENDIS